MRSAQFSSGLGLQNPICRSASISWKNESWLLCDINSISFGHSLMCWTATPGAWLEGSVSLCRSCHSPNPPCTKKHRCCHRLKLFVLWSLHHGCIFITLRTGCSGETRLVLHVPSSSWAAKRFYYYYYYLTQIRHVNWITCTMFFCVMGIKFVYFCVTLQLMKLVSLCRLAAQLQQWCCQFLA